MLSRSHTNVLWSGNQSHFCSFFIASQFWRYEFSTAVVILFQLYWLSPVCTNLAAFSLCFLIILPVCLYHCLSVLPYFLIA